MRPGRRARDRRRARGVRRRRLSRHRDRRRARRYGAIARWLHWTMFALIAFQIVVGIFLEDLPKGSALRGFAFDGHETVGIVAILLVLARIAWKLSHPGPAHLPNSTRCLQADSKPRPSRPRPSRRAFPWLPPLPLCARSLHSAGADCAIASRDGWSYPKSGPPGSNTSPVMAMTAGRSSQ